MIYKDYKRNHVILPGREYEEELERFLKKDYKGMMHKWENGFSSHSEDALTWSCFHLLSNFPQSKKISALNMIFEDAYGEAYEKEFKSFFRDPRLKEEQIKVYIGEQYKGSTSGEETEVDASIELPGKLIFFEAKLYSPVSMASPPDKPHDQIARKLRIGLDSPFRIDPDSALKIGPNSPSRNAREFFFIFLDIAPREKLIKRKSKVAALAPSTKGFEDKWKSAWLFNYYKFGRNNSLRPLKEALKGIDTPPVDVESVAERMGWLTWTDLFKIILKEQIKA